MQNTPHEAAACFVTESFPKCEFAILAGSASRGEETDSSDLDIVVFQNESESYRESLFKYDWRIEVFVHNYQSYLDEFEREREKGRPILGNMISEGKVIKYSPQYDQIRKNVIVHVSAGPTPLTKEYILASRYFIGDLLDDFVDSKNYEEALITLNNLSLQVPDFVLRLHNQWSGRGKGLTRALHSYDEKMYRDFFYSLNDFYKNGNKDVFVDFVHKMYEPVGGLIFEGYSSKG
ncbi:nucleotidyltransferase domain-containing protein [Rossellomorea aquimaris]|uniref:nucleotidyltransferase domain-containing protein n=1 Tax=Rossellomorea aquimaris TaxID=189382 RepID=UPI0009ECE29A|nr:nucleotidyltransferase domain-containing protein [Rossellomorea aquimaris]